MGSVGKKLAQKPKKEKLKKCPLCGDRHLGATKVCDKCKNKI